MPDGVDTSMYRSQPNPLATITNMMGIANTAQQNQLLQTANQQRMLELNKGYADDLLNTEATLTNTPGITSAQMMGELSARAKAIGAPPEAYMPVINKWRDLNTEQYNMQLQRSRARGMGGAGFAQTPFYQGLQPAQAPAAAFPAPAGSNRAGVTSVGVPLGGAPAVQKMQADLGEVGNFQETVAPWMQMHDYLEKLPEGSLGPGSAGRQHLEESLFALSPQIAKLAGVNVNKIKDYASFAKYSAQAANNLGGNGTDLKMMQTITGNPNPNINDPADRDLVKFGIGVLRMSAAKALEASRATPQSDVGTAGINYINRKADVSTKLDPNAFMYDLISPEQRAKLDSSLTGQKRKNFNYSIHIGKRNQLLTLPGQ